jgi:ABC-type branched-subunit amino acid transport system ATPase component
MLNLANIEVMYNRVILVLKGVSINVGLGKIIALLGANGAGKTTTLKAISGLLRTELGEVTDGSIEFDGIKIDRKYCDAWHSSGHGGTYAIRTPHREGEPESWRIFPPQLVRSS